MKFGAELLPNKKINALNKIAVKLEENGFDQVWVANHFNNRNTFCVLSSIAEQTHEIHLGPGVTNPYVTHPAETASAVQTIHEISKQRAIFGIGAGDKFTLKKIGLSWDKPLKRIEEAIEIIKTMLAGKKIEFEGEFFETNRAGLDFGAEYSKIPIHIGGQGPKMLELAGKIADGALINASNPKDIEFGVDKIKNSDTETEITAHTSFSIGEDRQKARKKAKEVVSFIIASVPDSILERHKIPITEANQIRKEIENGNYKKASSLVSEKMIDKFSVSGTVDDCIKQIKKLKEAGAENIVLGSPIGPEKTRGIELVGEEIINFFD